MALDQNRTAPRPFSAGGALASASRNRVLRNTYALLALSLVPTAVGAWLGLQVGFSWMAGNPFIGFMLFMAVAFGFFYAIERYKNSGIGVALLLGFTFFMGLMLSRMLGHVLGFGNGTALVMTAFGGTAAIFATMATVASVSKRDFSGMGKWLFMGLLVVIVGMVANIWLQMPALYLALSVMAIGIFSAWLLYDVQRIINGGETNYVTATLSIYLSLYNIFVHLLSLLGIFGGDD